MSTQNSQIARKAAALMERVVDQLGVLFLLALGVTTAGATLLAGV